MAATPSIWDDLGAVTPYSFCGRAGTDCGHGRHRRLLAVVSVEGALGSVELPGHVVGVVADRPVRELERHVGHICPHQMRLDERFQAIPDLLAGTVEIKCEPHQVE